jgi:ABC-type lipoprotein release transport system permease subunit
MTLISRLALRNLARNRRRTLLTAMIISFSLTALMFTDALIQGMTDTMVRSATRLYSGDAQIHHRDYLARQDESRVIDQPDAVLEQLSRESGVSGYAARTLAFGMVSSAANNRAVQVVGIDPEAEAGVSKLADALMTGVYLSTAGAETQLLIGDRLARLLEADLGDRIVVSVNNQVTEAAGQQLFRVSGIFHLNARSMDENLVFIRLPDAQAMMGLDRAVHEIAFNLTPASLATDTGLGLWQRLSNDEWVAQGWTELMPQLATMLQLNNSSTLIAAVVLFILAGLGVINGMFMSIYERTYEFGVMLAIGTRRRLVFRLILMEGLILALGAIAVGLVLGLLLTTWSASVGIDYGSMEVSGVALAEIIRPQHRAMQYSLLPFWVLVMTLIACIYPAVYAARIVPAKALHKSL